jgi:hypothetical protein
VSTQGQADGTGRVGQADEIRSTQRQIVLNAMRARPADPWPRGSGHVVLGTPGSPRGQKAYHEPGGGFSPCPGSFGVSVWILGPDGGRVATSDDLPMDRSAQVLEPREGLTPALRTRTPFYECLWTQAEEGRWRGEFRLPSGRRESVVLMLRSVGPAGGPVEDLDWDGRQLVVNHRWAVTFGPGPVRVLLADEETAPGLAAPAETRSLKSAGGWGFARIEPGRCWVVTVSIRDTAPLFVSPLAHGPVRSCLSMEVPDREFADSLDAQAAHLLMGFVGLQTCPGEPVNYPLAWERDGAYAVVAMARCGQLAAARQLARYFAENDFFGGFGAEADAPGSAIQALATVALISGDDAFLREIWPHVRRKAGLIEEMLDAGEDVLKTWLGPIVPIHRDRQDIPLVCRPAKDGLIVGNMDHHFPVLYINAFSHRGLTLAARLAGRLGQDEDARRWLGLAAGIREAWLRHFADPEYHNERTFMSALWPTWIADPAWRSLRCGLDERWEKVHGGGLYPERPMWTYFTVAEAHQWLFLDRPDRVWQTLRYFWANQCSPGLYTYWEGSGEENSFHEWENLRGWVAPAHVTPHYWTAAEMLLLQLDMLAYVDESQPTPVLVVGAGVPAEWTSRPMSVSGMQTILGPVDWSWDGRTLEVVWRGAAPHPVRPGTGFGGTAAVEVRHDPR